LDQETHYIFKYWYSYPFHWQKQKTSVMVTGVEDAKKPADFMTSGLPVEMEVLNGKRGTYSQNVVTNGRIVEVYRWNTYVRDRPLCSFVLDQGGSRRSHDGPVANEVTFNVYSETACQYVESIIPYGLELKVTYDTAYLTLDGNSDFAFKITVDRIPGISKQGSADFITSKLNEQQKQLLLNPEFQHLLEALIKSEWEKMYGPGGPAKN
jgi:hypothetical protein